MLVKDRMTPDPICGHPEMPVTKAQELMRANRIRHLPVVGEQGTLVGLITQRSLLRALPSDVSNFSRFEVSYVLSKIKVRDVMVKKIWTVTEDVTVEQAARIMINKRIGSLPVMRDAKLVGIITEIDLLEALSNLMGWRQPGVRVTVQVPDEKGQLARVATAIADAGGLLSGGGSYPGADPLEARITFKVRNVPLDELKALLAGMDGVEILDIRESPS
jgi:acetoin utilization protein AcuB